LNELTIIAGQSVTACITIRWQLLVLCQRNTNTPYNNCYVMTRIQFQVP